MTSTINRTRQSLSQESRVETIAFLHEQLGEGFTSCSESQQLQWYDRGLEPAYLHGLLDQLAESVSLLVSGLDIEDCELTLDRMNAVESSKKKHRGSRSVTELIERYSILIVTMRAAASAAAEAKDWQLTDICSEFAHRFDESLWFMVVKLHDNLSEV